MTGTDRYAKKFPDHMGAIVVNSIITYTLSIHNQSPKSPLSGGLHEASIRSAIGECLHIYIVYHKGQACSQVSISRPMRH